MAQPTPIDVLAGAAHSDMEKAIRFLTEHFLLPDSVVKAIAAKIDPIMLEAMATWGPRIAGGILEKTFPDVIMGSETLGHQVKAGVHEFFKVASERIKAGETLSVDTVGQLLEKTIKEAGDRPVWLDTFGNVHPFTCDAMRHEPDNRKVKSTYRQAVEEGRHMTSDPVCNKDGEALAMPELPKAKPDFRGKSIGFMLASMEGGMEKLEMLLAFDDAKRERILQVLRDEVSSPEELEVAFAAINAGTDIDKALKLLEDTNSSAQLRRSVKGVAVKATEVLQTGLDQGKLAIQKAIALDASLKPQVDALRARVERNRNAAPVGAGFWATVGHVFPGWWHRNKSEVIYGLMLVGAVLAAALLFQ